MLGVTLLVCLSACVSAGHQQGMRVLYQWKTLDFLFPDEQTRSSYNASTTFPLDVDVSPYDPYGRVFTTTPRFFPGVPAAVETVVNTQNGPKLTPYPSWAWNKEGDCNAITSALRVKADECGRLWVADTGIVENMTPNPRKICPAQLLVFNLQNDQLLWRYRIPAQNLVDTSLLANVAVDNQAGCNNPYAYVADITGYGVIVVKATVHGSNWSGSSWRFSGDYFQNTPSASHFDIDGAEFDLADGVISLALSPVRMNSRYLYFHSLAGVNENAVSTQDLKTRGNTLSVSQAQVQFSGQSGPAAMAGPILLFSDLPDNSLYCWNYNLSYSSQNIVKVYKDDVKFQFPSGLKAVNYNGLDIVYALTSRFQNIMVGRVDENEINYRILVAPVSSLVSGTRCSDQYG